MRWVTYANEAAVGPDERVGLVVGDEVRGLDGGSNLLDILAAGAESMADAAEHARRSPVEVVPLETARLRSPLPRPPSIRDFSAFEEHLRVSMQAMGRSIDPDYFNIPVFYFNNHGSVVGLDDEVEFPGNCEQPDFELEVAAVIGQAGRDLSPAEARGHIAGYCIYNDWSGRDLQRREMTVAPIGPSKGKDFANSLGPMLVTTDELEPFRGGTAFELAMSASVNGVRYGGGVLSAMYWTFEEMVAYASRAATLVPGDIVGSGTCSTGCILELSAVHGGDRFPWLCDGDEVVLEVEQLGTLRNTVRIGDTPSPLR